VCRRGLHGSAPRLLACKCPLHSLSSNPPPHLLLALVLGDAPPPRDASLAVLLLRRVVTWFLHLPLRVLLLRSYGCLYYCHDVLAVAILLAMA
jgi:hypothetical protein